METGHYHGNGTVNSACHHVCTMHIVHLCKCALDTVAGDNDSVALVGAPCLEQLPGQPALHHPRAGHDHTGTNVIKVINVLQGKKQMPELASNIIRTERGKRKQEKSKGE